jgi:hypothetical protein
MESEAMRKSIEVFFQTCHLERFGNFQKDGRRRYAPEIHDKIEQSVDAIR